MLETHRKEIEELDRKILELVSKRIGIVEEIGRIKREARIPLRDFEVESNVTRRLAAHCRELGVPRSLGADLAFFLIQKAIEVQSPIVDTVYDGDRMKILVMGGMGGMGTWVSRFLNVQGHQVEIYDTADGRTFLPRANHLETALARVDLTLLALPMSACADALRKIASHRPRGIVAEMCSLKSHLLPTFDEVRKTGLNVVSFHPMFGPDVEMLSGKQILLCRDDNRKAEDLVRGLFEGTSARIVEVDLADHDRYMAIVLGMAHLLNIGFAEALSRFGIPFEELEQVSSVTFEKQVATSHEVVSENPGLYYEIQAINPSTDAVLESLLQAFETIQKTVETNDFEGFERLMQESCAFFGTPPGSEGGAR